ncbi:MAG: hypothetical protein F7B61_04910 [Caldisphaeraceae archaeon]|nr:hypothetical protein [Caldisphaeraceae archaeon]
MSSLGAIGSCYSGFAPPLRRAAKAILKRIYFIYRNRALVSSITKTLGVGIVESPEKFLDEISQRLTDDQVRWFVSTYGFIFPRARVFIYQTTEKIPSEEDLIVRVNNSLLRKYIQNISWDNFMSASS